MTYQTIQKGTKGRFQPLTPQQKLINRIVRLQEALNKFYHERDAARNTYYTAKRTMQDAKREHTREEYYTALNALKNAHYENMDSIFSKINQCKADLENANSALSEMNAAEYEEAAAEE